MNGTKNFNVSAGPISLNSKFIGDNFTAGIMIGLEVEGKDEYGNTIEPCPDQNPFIGQISLNTPNICIAIYNFTNTDNDTCVLNYYFNCTDAGNFYLTYENKQYNNITINPGPLSLINSYFESTSLIAGETKTTRPHFLDDFHNEIPCEEVKNEISYQLSPNETSIGGLDCPDFSLSINKSGSYNMSVFYMGNQKFVNESGLTVAANIISAQSSIFGNGTVSASSGVAANFYIQPRDAYRNNIEVQCRDDTKWNISMVLKTGGIIIYPYFKSCTSNYNYFYEYIPSVVGNYTLLISLDGSLLVGGDNEVEVFNTIVSPFTSYASGSDFTSSNAGRVSNFSIILSDKFTSQIKGLLTNYTDYLIVSFLNWESGSLFLGSLDYNNVTLYTTSYSLQRSGLYRVNIFYNGTAISNSGKNLTIFPDQPFASYCDVTVLNRDSFAGVLNNFSIQCFDRFGNDATICYPYNNFQISIPMTNYVSTPTFVGCFNGVYNFSWVSTMSGQFFMSLSYNGEPFNQTITYNVMPTPIDPFFSYPEYNQTTYAGEISLFNVTARDRYDNTIFLCEEYPYANWTMTVDGEENKNEITCSEGVYSFSYLYNSSHPIELELMYNGFLIQNKSFVVYVSPSSFSPLKSRVLIPDDSIASNVPKNMMIVSKDVFNNNINSCVSGNTQNFGVELNGTILNTSEYEVVCSETTYVVQILFQKAAHYFLNVTYNGEIVGEEINFEITFADISFNTTSTLLLESSLIAGTRGEIMIYPRDNFENNITKCSSSQSNKFVLAFTSELGAQFYFGQNNVHCNGDGSFTVDFVLNKIGNYSYICSYDSGIIINQYNMSNITITNTKLSTSLSTYGNITSDKEFRPEDLKNFGYSINKLDILGNVFVGCPEALGDLPNHITFLNGGVLSFNLFDLVKREYLNNKDFGVFVSCTPSELIIHYKQMNDLGDGRYQVCVKYNDLAIGNGVIFNIIKGNCINEGRLLTISIAIGVSCSAFFLFVGVLFGYCVGKCVTKKKFDNHDFNIDPNENIPLIKKK